MEDKYIKIRREIHLWPEVSWQEFETQKRILEAIKACDKEDKVQVRTCETGVIVDLKETADSAETLTIALRADIDALPIQEETTVSYKSKNEGVMHACGHDGHIAILLMTLETVLKQADKLPSSVGIRFIFQPAEELDRGATTMIENKAMEGVDWVFGIHNLQAYDLGTISCKAGPVMAKYLELNAWISTCETPENKGNRAVSSILIASKAIKSVNQMVKMVTKPDEKLALGFGELKSDSTQGEKTKVSFTIRLFSEETAKLLKSKIKTIFEGTAKMFGATVEFNWVEGELTANHPEAAEIVKQSCEGEFNVSEEGLPLFGSEDFGEYTQIKKGAFFFLNGRDKEHNSIPHTNIYNFNDKSLKLGVKAYLNILNHLCKTKLEYLE